MVENQIVSNGAEPEFPYHSSTPPTEGDVESAATVLEGRIPTTPTVKNKQLSDRFDADVYLKREDTLPTGSFKIRGALHLLEEISRDWCKSGIIASSTGNYGIALSCAANRHSIDATICVPETAPDTKVKKMEAFGASVERRGKTYDDARKWVERTALEEDKRYVHSANEPHLVSGLGTAGLELREQVPEADTVLCPAGTGAYASGYALSTGDSTDVICVQSEAVTGLYEAWKTGDLSPSRGGETVASGIALETPFELPTTVLRNRVDEFQLVADHNVNNWVSKMFREQQLVVEPSSATVFAALENMSDRISGSSVVVPVTGRNVDTDHLSNCCVPE
jgi:threonine dehydratase